jgi:flagellar hook assembly protein FlgD
MKKLPIVALTILICAFQLSFIQEIKAQTSGQVSFTFKTVTQNGTYAPKHVLAAWIEDDGGFVKTRLVRANQRKQYLYTWKASSNSNEVDAITGSTLTSHQTMNVEWDCTDRDGNVVPDGEYVLWVEFTEKHGQGPLTSITFTKGTEAVHLTPPNEANYIDMIFDYTPDGVGVEVNNGQRRVKIFPNPSNGIFQVENPDNEELHITVFSMSGIEIERKLLPPTTSNQLDLTGYSKGNYLLRITGERETSMVKVSIK